VKMRVKATLCLLALVVATALVATEARSMSSRQQRCFGRLVADARSYNRDQAGRLKEIRLINQMITMVRRVGAVKAIETDDSEDLETEEDVEEERRHRELHGRGGVMQLLHQLKAKLTRQGRNQNANVHRRMHSCGRMCSRNIRVSKSRYHRAASQMRRSRSIRNTLRGRYQTRVSLRRQRIGAHKAQIKLYIKKRRLLNREVALINRLLAMVNKLHSIKSVQEMIAQAKTSELEEMKPVISELQRVSPESRKIQKLLIALRNKLMSDKRAAWNRVVRAKRAISVARRNERAAYNRYRNAHARYVRSIKHRNSMHNNYRRQVATCRSQARYIRKLRRM